MPMARMCGCSASRRLISACRLSMACGIVVFSTVGSSRMNDGLPARSNRPISMRLRANLTPSTWNARALTASPIDLRLPLPSRAPVSTIAPLASRWLLILLSAAGVRCSALAICAREAMPWWCRYCSVRARLYSLRVCCSVVVREFMAPPSAFTSLCTAAGQPRTHVLTMFIY